MYILLFFEENITYNKNYNNDGGNSDSNNNNKYNYNKFLMFLKNETFFYHRTWLIHSLV